MAAKTLQTILGRHAEVIADFRRQLAAVQRPEGPATDAAVRQKERLLASLEERAGAAKEAREATVARLDASIAGLEKRAARLKAEIEEDRRALDPRGRPPMPTPPIGRTPVVTPPARPPLGPVTPSLTAITGVGKVFEERLQAQGIRSAAEVAKMKPAQLAEALSISEGRAKALVDAAKKVKK
jgi:predicted flap endonuclease-1-like 5' DNA nuclease